MNLDKHPVLKKLYEACLELERLPASEAQTQLSIELCSIAERIELLVDKEEGNFSTLESK